MKRISCLLVLTLILVGVLTANALAQAKIEISLLTRMAGTTPQVDIFKDILEEFAAKYPDVVIIDQS
ncbi:MAG: ABC transporter substrate-binding protein, partial [Firmicutes bacterium]|nr:ABC transporter substrate-binding protein [Bacillota bacterium]